MQEINLFIHFHLFINLLYFLLILYSSKFYKIFDRFQAFTKKQSPVWCGGMLEAGIGRSHNIAMSTLHGFSLPGDVSASKRYFKEDIIDPPVTVSKDGFINVPQVTGTGYEPKESYIEKITVRKEVFSV